MQFSWVVFQFLHLRTKIICPQLMSPQLIEKVTINIDKHYVISSLSNIFHSTKLLLFIMFQFTCFPKTFSMTNFTLPYIIKLFQDILILVISSCSVVTVMQICGMMKESQKIKELQIQDSVYVVEMAKLNFHCYRIQLNISTNFCMIMVHLILKITNRT